MFDKLFDDTFGKLESVVDRKSGDALLKHVKELYGLSHVAYLCINLPTSESGSVYFQGTYSDSWVRYYKSHDLALVDPVTREGLSSIVPLDWDVLRLKHPKFSFVFDEAKNHNVGKRGMSFPIRGVHGELALFTITADVSEKEWEAMRRILVRDMQVFAAHFHNKILHASGADTFKLVQDLSSREVDCLSYVAAGLTLQSTADRLRITERTVRFHLENARVKLDCLSTSQAVAKAVALGFVFPR